jgi:hypothetical protein
MRDPSRARDGEGHVPTAASEDGGALGEAALGEAAMVVVARPLVAITKLLIRCSE